MNRWLVLLGLGMCIAGHVDLAYAEAYIFNTRLINAYRHYEETFSSQRNTLLFESGETANNCSEYFERKKSSAVVEAVNNQIVLQEYLVCDSVKLLKQSDAQFAARYKSYPYGKALLRRLDLRTFPSSLRQSVDDEGVVLSKFKGLAVKTGHYSITSETNDWLFKIEVVAEFDMDGNGKSDWLLWLIDTAKKGNYRSYNVLVVRNPSRQGLISAEIVP